MLVKDSPESPYDLRDTNILNPEWVTGGVYKILNNNGLMQREGVLETVQLGGILDDSKCYPAERHKFLIEMMRKFELCFEFPDSHGQKLLIPELLRPNEPELDWPMDDSLQFQYHYNVLPGGIISRFIVKMHHNLTRHPTFWRSGVVLEIDGNKALVRGDTQAGRVYISIRGPERGRRRALAVIRNAFKAIHATIPKIVAEQYVPLPDQPLVGVPYDHLLELEAQRIDRFLPPGSKTLANVQTLLDGIEDKELRIAERDRRSDVGLDREKTGDPGRTEDSPAEERRSKLNIREVLIVGGFFLFSLLALIGSLALVSKYVESGVAMTAITSAGVLFTVLFFAFLALFTGMFGAKRTERIINKIVDKVPLLRSSPPPKPTKKARP